MVVGIDPAIKLSDSRRCRNFVKYPICVGRDPEKLLRMKFNLFSDRSWPMEVGMTPVKRLVDNAIPSRSVNNPMDEGSVPKDMTLCTTCTV